MNNHLSGIPAPIPCESLISWIQRVCQIYDLTYSRFHTTFETVGGVDADLCMTSNHIPNVARLCRLSPSDFVMLENSFCRFAERPELRRLLNFQSNKRPLYRFCAQCWATEPIPFLRLEWRFKVWEFCPHHHTPLRETCPSCKQPLAMHRSILGGTTTPAPVPNLAFCLYCRADMRLVQFWPLPTSLGKQEFSNKISFQRAVVSAVLHDYLFVEPFQEKFELPYIFTLTDEVNTETLNWILTKAGRNMESLKRRHIKRKI